MRNSWLLGVLILAFATTARAAAPADGGPSLKWDQFRQQVQLQVAEVREEQIRGILRLMELGAEDEEIPELKFRLAELYYEKSQFHFFRSEEVDEKSLAADSPSARAALEAESESESELANNWIQEATQLYDEIREQHPSFLRMPEVLFALGQTYWASGLFDAAIEIYSELIQSYEDSPLVSDAWLAFGEYYFNERDLQRALKAYELAAADPRSRVYGFALYKQGWCYYNLAQWKPAVDKFRATVRYAQGKGAFLGENRISLGQEAQRDFVSAYSHIGNEDDARATLADLLQVEECTERRCLRLLERLANVWLDQGSFDRSASLYRDLVRFQPGSPRIPFYQAKIVDLVSRSGDKPTVIKECKKLAKVYGSVKSKDRGGADGEADLEEARILAESTIRTLAQLWNTEGKKTRNNETYAAALELYDVYLKLFPEEKLAYDMRFQLADLYYKLERFDDAARAYAATVEADPKGKYAEDAAHDSVLAIEEHLKDLRLETPAKGAEAVPIHPQRLRLVEACDAFLRVARKAKRNARVATAYKAAKVYYDHNHLDEALKRFDAIVRKDPAAKQAEYAANLVVDVHNLRQDWKSLTETATEYGKIRRLLRGRKKLAQDLRRFAEYGQFKLISLNEAEALKTGLGLRAVAEAYESFQKRFPKSENGDKALFNASVVWDKIGDAPRAARARKRLLAEYKKSPLHADVAYYYAGSLQQSARFEKAADALARFAERYPRDKRARDALYNSAVFLAGTGKFRAAAARRKQYLARYGKAKGAQGEAAGLYLNIAEALERAGQQRKAAREYEAFAETFRSDDRVFTALWNASQIYRRLGKKSARERIERTLRGVYRRRTRQGAKVPQQAHDYVSRLAFNDLQADFDRYRAVRIAKVNLRRPQRFARSLEEKAGYRDRLIRSYTKVVTKYKQGWSTVASLYRIALSWDIFVASLLKVPCPKRLSEDQCLFFKQGLEEKIGPARGAALEAYVRCVDTANKISAFTQHTRKCVQALETLAPDRFPPLSERMVKDPPTTSRIRVKMQGPLLEPTVEVTK